MAKLVGLILALAFGVLALLAIFIPPVYSEPNSSSHDSHFCPIAPFYNPESFIEDLSPDSLSHDSAEIVAAECSRKLDSRVRLTVSATAIGFASFLLYVWSSLKELTLRVSYLEGNLAGPRRSIREVGQHGNAEKDQ